MINEVTGKEVKDMFRKFNLLNVTENHANKILQYNKATGHEITSVYRKR